MRAISFSFCLGGIFFLLSCLFPLYLQAAEQQDQERHDLSIAIPPPPPDDGEVPLEITPELLEQFTQEPNDTKDLIVLRHKTTGEYWTLLTQSKEIWIMPEGMTNTSWVKWPRLRKVARWIGKAEPAAWLVAGFTIIVAVPTFGWAQPWWGNDPDPKKAFQTYSGIGSSGAIMLGLLPLTVICVDRHLNPKPEAKIRRYYMREGTMTTYHMGEDTF